MKNSLREKMFSTIKIVNLFLAVLIISYEVKLVSGFFVEVYFGRYLKKYKRINTRIFLTPREKADFILCASVSLLIKFKIIFN